MSPLSQFSSDGDRSFQVLWQDGDRIFCRAHRGSADGDQDTVLAVLLATDHPTRAGIDRLAHEYGLRNELNAAWAVRPLELVREGGRSMLVLEDPGAEPLSRLLGAPLELGRLFRFAIGISSALGKAHQRGLVHKDIKPANILVNATTNEVRLTGFGIASRSPRERPAPEPPETIAGTLAYMAPEQTGRMNRSIDARSDLYALGVTLFEMITGALPFIAADPMEWVHCHVARKPVPPGQRVRTIPAAISAIIMKLLAKTAEERYQTAAGVEHDLRRCLAEWEVRGMIDDFPLGQQDTPDRLLIPEKLYGREREVEALLAAFDRIVQGGAPELVLVSGYSGIGKSSVVNELHRPLVPSRGLFAAGKFDQFKRDIPYATLAQAFQSLVRPLLGKSDAELNRWREALLEAVGPNGRLMVDVVPELKLIIGEQPPVSELAPRDAQRRFQLVFRRFLGVFARPEHPLALFLDDLQWLDAATLDLIEDLMTRSDLQHLMLIGAYRDNEVTAANPLMRTLDAIRTAGGKIAAITLAPLAREDLGQMIAAALRCPPAHAAPLARLVHEKTGGNPFFAIQFISSLAEERMLTFDHDAAQWSWDLDRIHNKGYTDNVVDLMVGRLVQLPADAQKALRELACLGNAAEVTTLSMILGIAEEQVDAALWSARCQELVERVAGAYRFVHDRVQEAAYSLIPEELRGEAHLRIGRLLAAHTPPETREEAIFDIVNQLNRGASLITSREEREQVAELNLTAGKRAKSSTAYASALAYLTAGAALLPERSWEHRYELIFELELHRGECEYLIGKLAEAEQRLADLATRARTVVDSAAVACARLNLYTILDRSDDAVAVGLEYLRRHEPQWSLHPTAEVVNHECSQLWQQLEAGSLEALLDLPMMSDPDRRATMNVLAALLSPAQFTDLNLFRLIIIRMATLSLEHGNTDGSCVAYALLGGVLAIYWGQPQAAVRVGRLALDLVEKRRFNRLKGAVYSVFAVHVAHWTQPLAECGIWLRRAFEAAREAGDLTFAAFARVDLVTTLLALGESLEDVESEAESALAFVQGARFGQIGHVIVAQLRLIRALRGKTSDLGSFNDPEFRERAFERHLENDTRLVIAASRYWIRKLQAAVYAGHYANAVEAALRADRLLWTLPSQIELPEYHFYAALAWAGHCDSTTAGERSLYLQKVRAHHEQIALWATSGLKNLAHRAALLDAELARLEGRELDAIRLYDEAVHLAREQGFVQHEGIANELAARFWAARGSQTIADAYRRNARHCYRSWRADGKERQFDLLYPHLVREEQTQSPMRTIGEPLEHLDLATVIKVSQALSSEILLEKLLETLMRTAMTQAGAERALLILAQGTTQRIAAEATTRGDIVTVQLRDEDVAGSVLPEAVLNYVWRIRECVILNDAAAQPEFAADPYIRQRRARSILCLPLLNQAKLLGVLYLENNLSPWVFAASRLPVLKLLASQAAVSLENSKLYRDLAEREARIRCLVDSDVIGIVIWDLDGRLIDANDAFLRMLQYEREDLNAGLRWFDMTPPEWQEQHVIHEAEELKTTGAMRAREKEFFRKDGSRVPVLIGAAAFEAQPNQGVAYVLDLSERKRAEAAARDSEQRYREVQMELAHASRLATMGQLTGSIAHEVNQPITGMVIAAQTALRRLDRQPPDPEQVRQSFNQIAKYGTRAGEVIGRIRGLIRKEPAREDLLAVNGAILEVIELTRGETEKNRVSIKTELAEGLPLIRGDQVQLQQVMLNLIINAVEAMSGVSDRPRELLIRTRKSESGDVHVVVQDSGPGLSSSALERIFEAFYTTKPTGLGMGLSICRSIIEAHRGRLWATANGSEGARFEFTLPQQSETIPPGPSAR
ncbi:trifunctional serine/threonine-protein kinase/ATP-binding protein/sensor histidine kinase [Bradyrhizobium sp. Tv2a-2]|uniref:trifunctional serine/threonine-protein kinase/ATP-binding protein/sensor histidine kinase n=1 Tax=Bradyrhizobium sp. Tv2a-2 TaxID=113395 RepID=UPI0003FDA559|nr:trifunctional serine/threonine-protein kinase/ATP-binding protein/sensor histidine kinase [Bradyrhizobium sp. Tv2a-2]